MSTLDDKCNPEKNSVLAHMLNDQQFDYRGIPPQEFINAYLEEPRVAGYTIKVKGAKKFILMLLPNEGTGVATHAKVPIDGEVTYLGSVTGETARAITYRVQKGEGIVRDKTQDEDKSIHPGESFNSRKREGAMYGYHNHSPVPIALIIER